MKTLGTTTTYDGTEHAYLRGATRCASSLC